MSDSLARQVEELQRKLHERDKQIHAIHSITSALGGIVRQQDLIRQALETSMTLVQAGAGSIILHDPDRDKLVFTHVVGPTAEQLVGMEMAPDQGIAGAVFQSGALRVSDDVSSEKEHDSAIGEKVHYRTRNMVTVPLKSVEGEPIGVMQVLNKADGIFTEADVDILAILGAQIASAIETSRLHERARLAEVIQFIGHISHDVKNMVTPVQTGAETLQFMLEDMFAQLDEICCADSADGDLRQVREAVAEVRDFYAEMLNIIVDGSTNVQERTKEISDCIKGMVSRPHFAPVDLNDLVGRVTKPLLLVATSAGVHLSHELAPDLPPTCVDDKQLYNAIYNLVNNAIQACEEGATVTVRTGAVREGAWPEGSFAMLQVQDTGSGIPEHVRAKLFTDDAISTKPGGTGLGTRIIGDVVRAHGGIIEVDSEVGVGTTMTVKLPLVREESD
ncbi:MAG: ATP-binding protein [Armatimonadota bacterium]